MLVEDTLFLDYLSYASFVVGAALIVIGVFRRHQRLLIFIGFAVPGATLGWSVSEKIPLQFDVVIVEQPAGEIAWRKVLKFVGGEYAFDDGRRVRLDKPEGGPIATVVVNDTRRRLHIIRVAYAANPRLYGAIRDADISVIEARGTGATLARIEHFGPRSEGPPASIQSLSSTDTIDWLAW